MTVIIEESQEAQDLKEITQDIYEYIVSYSDEYIGCVEESHKCFEDAKRELDALSEMREEGLTILRAKIGGDYTHVLNNDQWIKFC